MDEGWITINLNDVVRFRFNGPEGEKDWRNYWAPYTGKDVDPLTFVPADEQGWRETQLWCLMQVIGPSFKGCYSPIQTNIQVSTKKEP